MGSNRVEFYLSNTAKLERLKTELRLLKKLYYEESYDTCVFYDSIDIIYNSLIEIIGCEEEKIDDTYLIRIVEEKEEELDIIRRNPFYIIIMGRYALLKLKKPEIRKKMTRLLGKDVIRHQEKMNTKEELENDFRLSNKVLLKRLGTQKSGFDKETYDKYILLLRYLCDFNYLSKTINNLILGEDIKFSKSKK